MGVKVIYDPSVLQIGAETNVDTSNWDFYNFISFDTLGEIRMAGATFDGIS